MESSQADTEKFRKYLENKLDQVVLDSSPDAKVIKTKGRGPTKPAPQNVQKIELNAQTIQEKNEYKVNSFDGRSQILATAQYPNSAHGVIAFKVNDIKTWGTGILIAPHIVLTAGHNLYDFKRQVDYEVQDMQFLPGMNGQLLPFGVIEIEKSLVSPNYIKDGSEDYGILILKEPVGEMTGYFGLACLKPEEITGKKINVTGYPGDKVASKPNTYEMWGMEGTVANIDQNKGVINYLIDTGAGQSGSGVWYKEAEDYYVCGVHANGTPVVNKATLLTRAMYKQIHTWVQHAGFKEHLLKLKWRNYLLFNYQEINVRCVSLLMKYNLDDLTILNLYDTKIGDEEVKILAQNTSWINLSELNLAENNIEEEGAKALAQNITWRNLSELILDKNNIGAQGAKAISQNLAWSNLSRLDLSGNKIGAKGAQALAQNTFWINLSKLNLFDNNIRGEGARALAQNISWWNLSELDLGANYIDDEGLKALAQNTAWTKLTGLSLSSCGIGVEGAKTLAQNTSWTNLSYLWLWNNKLGTEGAKALVQNTSWIKLTALELSSNGLGGEGALALGQNTSWTKLERLVLGDNNLGAEGAKALALNTSWINLSTLYLYRNNIGPEGVNALKQNKTWENNDIYI